MPEETLRRTLKEYDQFQSQNFEIKLSFLHLVQQDRFAGAR